MVALTFRSGSSVFEIYALSSMSQPLGSLFKSKVKAKQVGSPWSGVAHPLEKVVGVSSVLFSAGPSVGSPSRFFARNLE